MKTKYNKILLFTLGILLAPVISAQEDVFLGLYPEVNAHSREKLSFGGGLITGLDINRHFSAGIKASFFYDLKTVSALEPQAFFRYYLPWLRWPGEKDGPFVQAEAGSVIYWEFGEIFPAFSGGLAVGWRFSFAKNWYAEPTFRFGYPYIWGASAAVGYKFNLTRGKK